MNTANSVNWFEIYVQDMARARAFYETVFGIRLEGLKVPDDPDSPGLEMLAFPGDMEITGRGWSLSRP